MSELDSNILVEIPSLTRKNPVYFQESTAMSGLVGLVNLNGSPLNPPQLDAFVRGHLGPGAFTCSEYHNPIKSAAGAIHGSDISIPIATTWKLQYRDTTLLFFGETFDSEYVDPNKDNDLLRAYLSEGSSLFARLNGSFVAAIFEDRGQRITLVGDRTSSLPLYYSQRNDIFAFGYRLRPFIDLFESKLKVDTEAVSNFLTSGYLLQGNTLLEGVKILEPGHLITIDHGRISKRKYWQLSFAPRRTDRDEQDIVQSLAEQIKTAVKRRIEGDTSFGVLLSGGYDSRAILGCLKAIQPDADIFTITWGADEHKPGSDAQIASRIAKKCNTKHTFYKLEASELPRYFREYVRRSEGRTDAVGNYPEGLAVFERIKSDLGIRFLLRGDEIFGWRENVTDVNNALRSLDIHEMHNLSDDYSYLNHKISNRLKAAGAGQVEKMLNSCPYDDIHDIKDYFYFNSRLFSYLMPLNQLKQQALWMRNPYLDNDIIDLVVTLQTAMRLGKSLFKRTVETIFPELHQLGYAKYSNLINWNSQLRTDQRLQNYVRRILISERNGLDEYINRYKLEKYIEKYFESGTLANGVTPAPKSALSSRVVKKVKHGLGFYKLSFSEEIFRLMILKVFADEFLSGNFELS